MLALLSSSESPPVSSSKTSGRKGSKKVRTGCITCKIRKVKCDEAKPYCLRCVKTGRKCDGYKQSPGSSPGSVSASPISGFESADESRAFDYYRNHSARILSGTVDVGFWSNVVIKLSTTEPAVRHAMLAVSSLHECVETKSKSGRELDRTFAFQEYGKAIRSLRNWTQRSDMEPSTIPLLVCVLFVCIEFLADRDAASQLHIWQGRKILSGLRESRSPEMEMIKQSLVPIYARLSLASFLHGSRPDPIPEHLMTCTSVPAMFTSLDDSSSVLYHILDEGLQFSAGARGAVFSPNTNDAEWIKLQSEQHRLLGQLSRWDAAFTVLVSMSPQTPSLINAQNLLRIYHQASLIWISTALQPYELAYDAHLPAFASIISLASAVISNTSHHSSKAAAFSFETELVAPVYWVATKCRHPMLRRAALRLLSREKVKGRRENLWHTPATIAIAARVIELEEAGVEGPHDWSLDPSDPLAGLNDFMKREGRRPGYVRRQDVRLDELKISLSEPPTLSPPPPSFNDISLESSSDATSSHGSSSRDVSLEPISLASLNGEVIPGLNMNGVDESNLEAPFGIDEFRRVKNATIGPMEDGGVWTTFFRDPDPGESEWKITREFLRC
ncbi:Fc.00g045100.m01.CDS01 [Cosmosporella sp. VM-42]